MAVRTMILLCALLVVMGVVTTGHRTRPTVAFCKIAWLVGVPCEGVSTTIVNQIEMMGAYTLVNSTLDLIKANHTGKYMQKQMVNFTMTPIAVGMGCQVTGMSVSPYWYSIIDNTTNYCNLYSVMWGSKLTEAPGFTQYTNNVLCTGQGALTCKL